MKTAQEWKDALGLAELPDAEYLADLNALDGQETVDFEGADPARFVAATPADVAAQVVLASAGQAFREARRRAGFTVRKAAEQWGMSPGRVSQVEADDANLYAQTIAETAQRMGYRARLVLEPLDGGEPIAADLRAT